MEQILIGEGAFGQVYQTRMKDGRIAAYKQFYPKHTPLRHRFQAAVTAMMPVKNPNCAEIFGWDAGEGAFGYWQELVDGNKSISCLKGQGVERIVRAAIQICNGLDALHARRIVYRDLKPKNILLTQNDTIKIIDLDSIPIGETDEVGFTGNPCYASPEHFPKSDNPPELDPRSDLYALGVLLHELLTGRLPFVFPAQADLREYARIHAETPPDIASDLPAELQEILFRLLAKDPADRYSNAYAVAVDLAKIIHAPLTMIPPSAYLLSPRFVDRTAPQQELWAAFQAAQHNGSPRLAVLSGESGVGKTWLAEKFQRQAQAAAVSVIVIKCEPESGQLLRDLIIRLIAQMNDRAEDEKIAGLGEFGWDLIEYAYLTGEPWTQRLPKTPALTDAKAQETRFFDALTGLIQTLADRPLLICLDDLHWADDKTLRWLAYAARNLRLNHSRAFLLGLSRVDDDRAEAPELLTQLQRDEHTQWIALDKLDSGYVAEMAAAMLGLARPEIDAELARVLSDQAAGNPLFVRELLYYFLDTKQLAKNDGQWELALHPDLKLPNRAQEVLNRRLGLLAFDTQLVLQRAVVIGREFDLDLLGVLTGQSEGERSATLMELERARSAFLLDDLGGGRYRLIHDAVREALSDEARKHDEWKAWHRGIGEALEARHADNKDMVMDDLARLFYIADHDAGKTIEYCGRAGDLAKRRYENEKAVRFYDLSIEKSQNIRDRYRETEYWLRVGDIHYRAGCWEKGETAYQTAIALSETTTNTRSLALAKNYLAEIHRKKGQADKALVLLQEVLHLFEAINDKEWIGRVHNNIANIYLTSGDLPKARELYQMARVIAEEESDELGLSRALGNMGVTFEREGNYEDAMDVYEKSLAISEKLGIKYDESRALSSIGDVYLALGDYIKAREYFAKALAIDKQIGYKDGISSIVGSIGISYKDEGNYEEAIHYYERALFIERELGDTNGLMVVANNIGSAYLDLGQWEKASEYFNDALKNAERQGNKKVACVLLGNLGTLFIEQGLFEQALDYLTKAITFCKEIHYKYGLCWFLYCMADMHFRIQQYPETLQLIDEIISLAQTIQQTDILFKAKILSKKIHFLLAKDSDTKMAIIQQVKDILFSGVQDSNYEHKVILYHELWHMTHDPVHRDMAIALYQELIAKTPKYEYKKRLEELQSEG